MARRDAASMKEQAYQVGKRIAVLHVPLIRKASCGEPYEVETLALAIQNAILADRRSRRTQGEGRGKR